MNENNILDNIKKITLDFFVKINAEIKETNKIYTVSIPIEFKELFNNSNVKFTFDSETAREELCELIAPGSNILFKIINYNLKNGSVIYTKPKNYFKNSNIADSIGIRFHFFILLDGIKNQSYVKYIDIDYNSYNIIENNFELVDSNELQIDIDSEKIDYAYIAAIDEIKKNMQNISEKFIKDVIMAKNNDLKYVNDEYQKRLDEIDDSIQNQRNKKINLESKFEEKLDDAIESIDLIREEQKKILLGITKKHQSSIDYALFAAQIYPYMSHNIIFS